MHVLTFCSIYIGLMLVLNEVQNQFNGGLLVAALSVGCWRHGFDARCTPRKRLGQIRWGNWKLSSWCSGAAIGKLMVDPARIHQIAHGCRWRVPGLRRHVATVGDYYWLDFIRDALAKWPLS